jgi:ankyrin repeat protein
VWHEVQIAGGRLNTFAHTNAEINRELVLGALNGPAARCAAVAGTWRTGRGWLPRQLRRQRREFYLHARAGRTDDVLAMLDDGFDIAAPDETGATLMHYLLYLDVARMWPRLLAARLPVDARDHTGRTALDYARAYGLDHVVRTLETA